MDNFIRYITGNTMALKTEAFAAALQVPLRGPSIEPVFLTRMLSGTRLPRTPASLRLRAAPSTTAAPVERSFEPRIQKFLPAGPVCPTLAVASSIQDSTKNRDRRVHK